MASRQAVGRHTSPALTQHKCELKRNWSRCMVHARGRFAFSRSGLASAAPSAAPTAWKTLTRGLAPVVLHQEGACRHICHATAQQQGVEGAASPDASELKRQLFSTATKLNSTLAGEPQQASLAAQLAGLAGQLSTLNPHPNAAESPLINGSWLLVYTAKLDSAAQAGSMLTAAGDDRATDVMQFLVALLYNFFYRNFPVLAGSAVGRTGSNSWLKVRGNLQVFDTAAGVVDNQVRFTAFGKPGCIRVVGSASVVQPSRPDAAVKRLKATFQAFEIEWDGVVRLKAPLSLFDPTGYVDTVYLDEEMRISYGDKGSIFIARRGGGDADDDS